MRGASSANLKRLAVIGIALGATALGGYRVAVSQFAEHASGSGSSEIDAGQLEISSALKSFYLREGRFPNVLDDLIPTDLSEIPSAGVRSEWRYKVDEHGASLVRLEINSEYHIWIIDRETRIARIYRD
jgi:hypothetical protein